LKKTIVAIFLVGILLFVNYNIFQKEQILANGKTVFLELAPVDPRSLMQGDYMELRYNVPDDIVSRIGNSYKKDGFLIVRIENNHVGTFVDLYDEDYRMQANEFKIRYTSIGDIFKIGAESFFFQEGKGEIFENSKYGELKLFTNGECVLVGLRDGLLNKLS
jgi:uncharacterized membrane-anchored protein